MAMGPGDAAGMGPGVFFQVRRLLSNLKPVQLEISQDAMVFAMKSRVFALWGAKALDFGAKLGNPLEFGSQIQGAKALDFFDFPLKT